MSFMNIDMQTSIQKKKKLYLANVSAFSKQLLSLQNQTLYMIKKNIICIDRRHIQNVTCFA